MLLSACGSRSLREQLKESPPDVAATDAELLNHLLDLEYIAILAYTAAVPILDRGTAALAAQFLGQELAHANGLIGLIKAAHRRPHAPPSTYDLGHPRSREDVLRALQSAEAAQLDGYLEVIPRLRPGPVRQATAGYFANDAQHISLVRAQLGAPPLPDAFVTGRE